MDSNEIELKKTLSNGNKIHPLEIISNDVKKNEEPKEERENWSGKLDFMLSALSYSVGLGAVWRFPYLCYRNGGGAFLVPFLIFMILVGIPIMYLELAVGQFVSRGPVLSWVMVPLFKGVGISMNLINNYVNVYYIMIIAYSLYFLILSFRTTLPWEKCGSWASLNCVDDFNPKNFNFTNCNEPGLLKCEIDGKCYLDKTINGLDASCSETNKSLFKIVGYHNPIYPSQDYWQKVILEQSESINSTGRLVWQLVLSLFVSWVICFFCLFRGVKLSGKIVYFTALFPYLVLFILGIRGFILDGASEGLLYFIKPDIDKLTDSNVWKEAAVQVFFTLSLSYGGLIALSSYNKFSNNILRDTLILSVSNFFTCILAGLVVFAYMGNLSKTTGLAMEKVVQSGQGLVYVVYPFAVTTLAGKQFWSVLFFLMMIALGMGTMMASVETLTTSLEDFFPILKKTHKNKAITLGIICLLYFLIGLLLCSQSGTYWVEFFNDYSGNWAIFVIGIVECISVAWFYGCNKFEVDISSMVESNHKFYKYMFVLWKICWTFITPTLLIAFTIWSLIDDINPKTPVDRKLKPVWSEVIGHLLSLSSLFGIFGWIIYEIINAIQKKKTFSQLIEQDENWHPREEKDQEKFRNAHLNYSPTPFISFKNIKKFFN